MFILRAVVLLLLLRCSSLLILFVGDLFDAVLVLPSFVIICLVFMMKRDSRSFCFNCIIAAMLLLCFVSSWRCRGFVCDFGISWPSVFAVVDYKGKKMNKKNDRKILNFF